MEQVTIDKAAFEAQFATPESPPVVDTLLRRLAQHSAAAPVLSPETQKARGVFVLRGTVLFQGLVPPLCTIASWSPMHCFPTDMETPLKYPVFARPCPRRPRHGFVESRVIFNELGFLTVIAETLAADPAGEVLFMPILSGQYSAVATNAGVVFGTGNDGATTGRRGHSKLIPVAVAPSAWIAAVGKEGVSKSGVRECPYVELVEHEGILYPVQLRDGPAQQQGAVWSVSPGAAGKRIEHTCDLAPGWEKDLMAVERQLSSLKKELPGAVHAQVLVRLKGANLFCHAAVQAIAHGFSVWVGSSRSPRVGEKFPTGGPSNANDWTAAFYAELAKYVAEALLQIPGNPDSVREHSWRISMAIATLHAHASWSMEQAAPLRRLIGTAIAYTFRYVAASLLGELRHYYSCGPGQMWTSLFQGEEPNQEVLNVANPEQREKLLAQGWQPHPEFIPPVTDLSQVLSPEEFWCFQVSNPSGGSELERCAVYGRVLEMPTAFLVPLLRQARTDFLAEGWRQGFGGLRWGEVTEATLNLLVAIQNFTRKADADTWRDVVLHWNNIINVCHNGGPALSKWIGQSVMSRLGACPTLGFLNSVTARLVLGIGHPSVLDAELRARAASILENLRPSPGEEYWEVSLWHEEKFELPDPEACKCCDHCGTNQTAGDDHMPGCPKAAATAPQTVLETHPLSPSPAPDAIWISAVADKNSFTASFPASVEAAPKKETSDVS